MDKVIRETRQLLVNDILYHKGQMEKYNMLHYKYIDTTINPKTLQKWLDLRDKHNQTMFKLIDKFDLEFGKFNLEKELSN